MFKAHRRLSHPTLGLIVIKKKNKGHRGSFGGLEEQRLRRLFFFFLITLKPRVESRSMSLKYEPASEPLHISVK